MFRLLDILEKGIESIKFNEGEIKNNLKSPSDIEVFLDINLLFIYSKDHREFVFKLSSSSYFWSSTYIFCKNLIIKNKKQAFFHLFYLMRLKKG